MAPEGMGCGPVWDTQYLFSCDVLGTTTGHHWRHPKRYADFVKLEAELQRKRIAAFQDFAQDVTEGTYPERKHEVAMDAAEYNQFLKLSQKV